jgi:hypothetical protein
MYSNQQPSTYTTRHYIYDPQSNGTNNRSLSFDQIRTSQSSNYLNDQPITSTNNYSRNNSSGSISRGSIEKTNMMSSENPFHNPARAYEQLHSARTITSITSPPKSTSGINKSLNLSDENPFHAIYGGYRYPSQIDPARRITNQTTAIRSTDNKSLNLSDENPFHATYGRYHYPSQIDPQKRITEIPKVSVPLIPINDLSDNSPFSNYRPSLIREYSAGISGSGSNSFSSSIADWTRNNPAPLSYRPIQVQRPPPDFYSQNESTNTSSYIPSVSPPRQQRQASPIVSPVRVTSQLQKSSSSAPLDKTSLNMSPDNPFADTYGRYRYPSSEEIKAQKRTTERSARFAEPQSISDNRTMQPTNSMTEYPDIEKKDISTDKGKNKFTRFDITF